MPMVAMSPATAMKQKYAIEGSPSAYTRAESSSHTTTSAPRPGRLRRIACARSERSASSLDER